VFAEGVGAATVVHPHDMICKSCLIFLGFFC